MIRRLLSAEPKFELFAGLCMTVAGVAVAVWAAASGQDWLNVVAVLSFVIFGVVWVCVFTDRGAGR